MQSTIQLTTMTLTHDAGGSAHARYGAGIPEFSPFDEDELDDLFAQLAESTGGEDYSEEEDAGRAWR